MTLLVPFGMIFLVSRLRGRGILEYKKALCVLLAAVFTFDTVMLGYFGAGGGVKEVQAAVPDGIYFYYNDHLGTPLRMVDEDGAAVWSADYLPFGQATVDPASTVESNWRFPGQFWDGESGLHYNVHRFYDPALGRYNRSDPMMAVEPNTIIPVSILSRLKNAEDIVRHLNVFVYGENNPLRYKDPLGLDPCEEKRECVRNAQLMLQLCIYGIVAGFDPIWLGLLYGLSMGYIGLIGFGSVLLTMEFAEFAALYFGCYKAYEQQLRRC